ncbi:MAG: DnaA/Hda family protein [Candidatus Sulfotelmatobacter sp.]
METIVAILRKRAKQVKVTLPKERAIFIAQNILSNTRPLELTLKRLAAYSSVDGTGITLAFTQLVLKNSIDSQVRDAVDLLQKSVAYQFVAKEGKPVCEDWTAAHQHFGICVLNARQERKVARVRQELEVNMRESERERLARRDVHERELALRRKRA